MSHLQRRIRNLVQHAYRCSGSHAAPNPIPYDGVLLVPTNVTDSTSSRPSLKEATSRDGSTAPQTGDSAPSDEAGGTHDVMYTRQHLRRTVSKVSSVASCPDVCAAEQKCAPLELRYPQRRRCPTRGKFLPERAEKRARLLSLAPRRFDPSTSGAQDDSLPSAREASVQSETGSDFGSGVSHRTLKLNAHSVSRQNPPGAAKPSERPGTTLTARKGLVSTMSQSVSAPDTALPCGSSSSRPSGRSNADLIRNAAKPQTNAPDGIVSSTSATCARDLPMKTEAGPGQSCGDAGTTGPAVAGPAPRGFVPMPFPTPMLATGSGMSMQRMMMMAAAARTSAGLSALCSGEPGAAQNAAAAALAFPHPILPALLMNRMHAYFHHICRLNAGVGVNMYVPPIDPAMPVGVLHAAPPGVPSHPKEAQALNPTSSTPCATPPLPLETHVEPRGDCCESKHGLLPEASFDLSGSDACVPAEDRQACHVQPSALRDCGTVEGQTLTCARANGATGQDPGGPDVANAVPVKPSLIFKSSLDATVPLEGESHSPPGGSTIRAGCHKPSSDPPRPSPDPSKASSDLPKPWTPEPVNERKQRAVQPLCTSPALCPLRVSLSETRIGAGVCKTWANDVDPTPHGPPRVPGGSGAERSKAPPSRRRGRRARGRGSLSR